MITKQALRVFARQFHLAVLKKPLPSQLALYLHEVEPWQRDALREMLTCFCDLGYAFVGPGDLLEDSDEKRIMVSFDDNFRLWCDIMPILDDLNASATFYISTQPIRDLAGPGEADAHYLRVGNKVRESLSSQDIQEFSARGHVIGCHTHSHPQLNEIDRSSFAAELDRPKQILEEILDQDVVHFAIPYGKRRHFNRALRDHCVGLGFQTVAYAISGRQHARKRPLWIDRSFWNLDAPLDYNLDNLQIDGRIFERLTGKRIGI